MAASDSSPQDYHVSNAAPSSHAVLQVLVAGQDSPNAWGSSIVTVMLVIVYQPIYRVREDTEQLPDSSSELARAEATWLNSP
ncbi:hypothetical protein MRX96_037203 [Rhipicephalus microplus]